MVTGKGHRLAGLLGRFLSPDTVTALRNGKTQALFEPNPNRPDVDLGLSVEANFVQEMQLAIDALPELQRILRDYPKDESVRLLDFGPGFGAGANLFAELYCSSFLACPLQVDALDIKPYRKRLAGLLFPRIHYMTGDLGAFPDRHWQIIYCSNVIEHTENPAAMLRTLVEKARDWVIVLAPFEEPLPLSPGHVGSFQQREDKSPIQG